MLTQLEALGRLSMGERPLVVVARNALPRAWHGRGN
jgi:hypothetical protein